MQSNGLYTYKYNGTYDLNALHRQVLNPLYMCRLDGVDEYDFHTYSFLEMHEIIDYVIDDFIENVEPEKYPLWFTLITNRDVRARLDYDLLAKAMTELHAWNVMKK